MPEKITLTDGRLNVPDTPSSPSSRATAPASTSGRPQSWCSTPPRRSSARRSSGKRCSRGRRPSTRPAAGCRRRPSSLQGVPDRHQGAAHHADRRRHPQPQRRAAPDPRPLRVPAPGALVHRGAVSGEASRAGRHGDLPGEHRRHLRRPRGRGRHARGGQADRAPARQLRLGHPPRLGHRDQADQRDRVEATGPGRDRYALKNKRESVTMVHKGNIQKFTEGAFRNWGYELVRDEFSDVAVAGTTAAAIPAGRSW